MAIAVIDIGSNSVRLMLEGSGGLNEKIIQTTQLAEGLDASGVLNPEAMRRTAAAIGELAGLARARGAGRVAAFATEAVRAARNGAEFTRMVAAAAGVEVDVIDGETEAACGFFGARADFTGTVAVTDIGGASVEFVVGDREVAYARSLPIGVVRLRDRYRGDYAALARELPGLLDGFAAAPAAGVLVGIGGTPTTVVAMARGDGDYDPGLIHGGTLTLAEIEPVAALCRRLSAEEIMRRFPSLVRRRAEVIPYGATLLAAIVERFGGGVMRVSEKDNLEGYRLLRLQD